MMYEKPEIDRRKLDDTYLLSEIARLKRETEELRKILDEMLLDTLFELPYTDGTTKLEIRCDKINKIKN